MPSPFIGAHLNFAFKTLSEPKANERINIAIFARPLTTKDLQSTQKHCIKRENPVSARRMQTINEYVINTNLYVARRANLRSLLKNFNAETSVGNTSILDQEQMDSLLDRKPII